MRLLNLLPSPLLMLVGLGDLLCPPLQDSSITDAGVVELLFHRGTLRVNPADFSFLLFQERDVYIMTCVEFLVNALSEHDIARWLVSSALVHRSPLQVLLTRRDFTPSTAIINGIIVGNPL
jgi:hypothetical protein